MNYRDSMFFVVRFCLFTGVLLHGMEGDNKSNLSLKELEQSICQFKCSNKIINGCSTILKNSDNKNLVKQNIKNLNAYIQKKNLNKNFCIDSLEEIGVFKAKVLDNQALNYQKIKNELNQQVEGFDDLIFEPLNSRFSNRFHRKTMRHDCDSLKKIVLIVGEMGSHIFEDLVVTEAMDAETDSTLVDNKFEQYDNTFKEKIITLISQSTQLLCYHEERKDIDENVSYLVNVTNVFDVMCQYHHKNGLLNDKKYSSAQKNDLGKCFTLLEKNFSEVMCTLLRFMLWNDVRSNCYSVEAFKNFFTVGFNSQYPECANNKFIKLGFTELIKEIDNNKKTINTKHKGQATKWAKEQFDSLEDKKIELYEKIEKFEKDEAEAILFNDKLPEIIEELNDFLKTIEAHNKYLEEKHLVTDEAQSTLIRFKEFEKKQKEIKNKIDKISVESFKSKNKCSYDYTILIKNTNELLDYLPNVSGIGFSSSLYKEIVEKALGFYNLIQDCSIKTFNSNEFKKDINNLIDRIDKQPLCNNLVISHVGKKLVDLIKTTLNLNNLTKMQFLLKKYNPSEDFSGLLSKEIVEGYETLQTLCVKHKESLNDKHDSEMKAMAENVKKVLANIENKVDVENSDGEKNKNHDQVIADKKTKERERRAQEEEKFLQGQRANAKKLYQRVLFSENEKIVVYTLIGIIEKSIELNFGPETNYQFIFQALDLIKASESDKKLSDKEIKDMKGLNEKFNKALFGDKLSLIQDKYNEILKIIEKKDEAQNENQID
jgi:hypothetical protein